MEEKDRYINQLLAKFEKGTATREEMQVLEEWFNSFSDMPNILDSLDEKEKEQRRQELHERITLGIEQHEHPMEVKTFRMGGFKQWFLVAASLISIFSAGYFFLFSSQNKSAQLQQQANLIQPGSQKATLTLSNGEQILLDDAKEGELSKEGNTSILKIKSGDLVYKANHNNQKVHINTLSTPRGGKYHITLADGTNVWLNAESSIEFPTDFPGNSREVSIQGEAYFEVAKNASKPFLVHTENQVIEVLGTHFNVNAYKNNSAIKTTLLEGSIALQSHQKRLLLIPGQQVINRDEKLTKITIDPTEVIAWKEGYFDFTDANIQSVIEEFARWYAIDIEYKGNTVNETFTGRIPRNWPFEKVWKIMQSFKSIQVEMQGRRIIVEKK